MKKILACLLILCLISVIVCSCGTKDSGTATNTDTTVGGDTSETDGNGDSSDTDGTGESSDVVGSDESSDIVGSDESSDVDGSDESSDVDGSDESSDTVGGDDTEPEEETIPDTSDWPVSPNPDEDGKNSLYY